MRNKIHKLWLLLLLLCCLLNPELSLQAQEKQQLPETNVQLFDDAGLLTQEESEEITQQLAGLEKTTGWDVMAYTAGDAGGLDATAYAETFFDEHTVSDNGIICGIDMDNREIVIRAFGEGQFYITDDRTERVLDAGYDDVSRKQYGSALTAMLKEVSRAVLEENPEQNYLQEIGRAHV